MATAFTVSPATARSVVAFLDGNDGLPLRARHDVQISLTALGHFTCAALERVESVLNRLVISERKGPERLASQVAFLRDLGSSRPPAADEAADREETR